MDYTLDFCLAAQSLNMLQAISRARGFPFTRRRPKAQSIQRLLARLVDGGAVEQAWRDLPDDARAVLRHLARQAEPARQFKLVYQFELVHQFELVRQFGTYRDYKPWAGPLEPWKAPISPVERLLYAGLIFALDLGTAKHPLRVFVLPGEIAAALAPLLAPSAPDESASVLLDVPLPDDDDVRVRELVLGQVFDLLCHLNARDVRPTHGRWLPPNVARSLAARLDAGGENAPERRSTSKRRLSSERQRPQLAFIHYLAERAGLLGLSAGLLKPTLAVHTWLALDPGAQIQALWDAWLAPAEEAGDAARAYAESLWQTYRLPLSDIAHPQRHFLSLLRALRELNPGEHTALAALLDALARHDPYLFRPTANDDDWCALGPELQAEAVQRMRRDLERLIAGPLAWFGLFEVSAGDDPVFSLSPLGRALLHGQPLDLPVPQPAPLRIAADDDAIHIAAPNACAFPVLWTLAELATPDDDPGAFRLTRANLLRALDRGHTVEQIVDLFARDGAGEPSPAVLHLLYTWANAHRQVVIHRPTLLEVQDAALLRDLSAVRRIRDKFTATLSARAVAVRADKLPQLLAQLERRDLGPTVELEVENPTLTQAAESADRAAIVAALRLAAELSHQLGHRVHIPHPLYAQWRAALTPAERAAADLWVDDLLRAWQGRIDQQIDEFQPPFPVQDTVLLLEQAIREQATVEMVYHAPRQPHAPGTGAPRRVDPLRLEQLGRLGTWYLIAFCHERGENRTFRVDRIAEVRIAES